MNGPTPHTADTLHFIKIAPALKSVLVNAGSCEYLSLLLGMALLAIHINWLQSYIDYSNFTVVRDIGFTDTQHSAVMSVNGLRSVSLQYSS